MGAAITLLTKKWVDAHGLAIKEKAAKYIFGASGTFVKIVGTTSITRLLAPTLELDVSNVAIFSGKFYQGLLGCDCCAGIMRHLAWLPSPCLGRTNELLLVACRRRWAAFWLPIWNCKSVPQQQWLAPISHLPHLSPRPYRSCLPLLRLRGFVWATKS